MSSDTTGKPLSSTIKGSCVMRLKIRSRLTVIYSFLAIITYLALFQFFPLIYIGITLVLLFLLVVTTRWDRNFFAWLLRLTLNRKQQGSYAFDNTITTANSVIDRSVVIGDGSNAVAITGVPDPGVIIWRDHIASTFIKILPDPLTASIVGAGNQFDIETINLAQLSEFLSQFELRLADIFVHITGKRGRETSDSDYGAGYTARLGTDVPGLYTGIAIIELRFDTRDMLFQCGRRVWHGETIAHGVNRAIRLCRDRLVFGLQHHDYNVVTVSDKDIEEYHTQAVSSIKRSHQWVVDKKGEKRAVKEEKRKKKCAKKNVDYTPKKRNKDIILPSDNNYEQPKKMVFSFFRVYEVQNYGLEDWRRWLKLQASLWFITVCLYRDKRGILRTRVLVGFAARQEIHNLARDTGLKLVAKTPREFSDTFTIFTPLQKSMIGFFLPLGSRSSKLLNLRSIPLSWIDQIHVLNPTAITAPPITGVGVYLGDILEVRTLGSTDVSRRGEKLFINPTAALEGSTLVIKADIRFIQLFLLRLYHCQIADKISVNISSSCLDKILWDNFTKKYPWITTKRGSKIFVCDVQQKPRKGELVIWLSEEDQGWDYFLEWNEYRDANNTARGVGLYRQGGKDGNSAGNGEYLFSMNILDIDRQYLTY